MLKFNHSQRNSAKYTTSSINDYIYCSLAEVFSKLHSDSSGLTSAEAKCRLSTYGYNVIPEVPKEKLSSKVMHQFRNLFNVLLLIAAGLSLLTGWAANDITSFQMGIAIIIALLLGISFSLFQEFRAQQMLEKLRTYIPTNVKTLRDEQVQLVSIDLLVPGDIIVLEEGDKIPADARLIEANFLFVNNVNMTGEAEPQPRITISEATERNGSVFDLSHIVFAGTTVITGSGKAVIIGTGLNTQFGTIINLTQTVTEPLSPLQLQIDRTAKINVSVALLVGIFFLFVAYVFLNLAIDQSVFFMIGVMISLVPEGLQVSVTLALVVSSMAMARKNVLTKRLSAVETLGSTTVICTDKTGTITTGQMTVRKIWANNKTFIVTGEGYDPTGKIYFHNEQITLEDYPELSMIGHVSAIVNSANLVPPENKSKSRWEVIGDSTDGAFLAFAHKTGIPIENIRTKTNKLIIIPFSSTRKMMTVVIKDDKDYPVLYTKGASLEILYRCTQVYWEDEIIPLAEPLKLKILQRITSLTKAGYRVLAVAMRNFASTTEFHSQENVEKGLIFLGLVALFDPPRIEVQNAVERVRKAGVKVIMLTGDHELTAESIARQVGIITMKDHQIITGTKMSQLSKKELSAMLESQEIICARITAEQKLQIVQLLQEKGEIVAVTGDGTNDAPVLLEANIGIAMGQTGTDVARESADMILLDDNFASIVNGIEIGRSVFANLKKYLQYVFSHNWAELVGYLAFIIIHVPLPISVMIILAIDLVLEIPPSLVLTNEPPDPQLMERQPFSLGTNIFNKNTLAMAFYIGVLNGSIALMWCFYLWISKGNWSFGMSIVPNYVVYLEGMTLLLTGIMAGQFAHLLMLQTESFKQYFLNKTFLISMVAEIGALITFIYIPAFQNIIKLAPLTINDWLMALTAIPIIIFIEKIRTCFSEYLTQIE